MSEYIGPHLTEQAGVAALSTHYLQRAVQFNSEFDIANQLGLHTEFDQALALHLTAQRILFVEICEGREKPKNKMGTKKSAIQVAAMEVLLNGADNLKRTSEFQTDNNKRIDIMGNALSAFFSEFCDIGFETYGITQQQQDIWAATWKPQLTQ